MQFIDLKTQYQKYKASIDAAIQDVLDSGTFILGPQIEKLEKQLAQFVGVKHCIAVSSGTDSLLIALMALGIGPGDEVITTPFTFISTAEVIALLGARTVFVDIDPETFNIDPLKIEAAVTERTKALMPVGLFGQMPDLKAIQAIADQYQLPIIEDAAQSFGATQNGKESCSTVTVGSTSFFPAKPLGCYGDGGALFTDNDLLAEKMLAIRTHGSIEKHHHPVLGINGRLDTLQAAILLAKLPHYRQEIVQRQEAAANYNTLLEGHCATPKTAAGNTHVYAQYTIRVSQRAEIMEKLNNQGIPTAVYYPKCLHEQPAFSALGYQRGDFPIAEQAADEVLSLPMHPWLTQEEQEKIAKGVELVLCAKECV